MRIFGYGRVSTLEQDVKNQRLALVNMGQTIEDKRWFAETVSGGTPALQRKEFSRLIERMEDGDRLVVLKLDRLGRDVLDVLKTIQTLSDKGIQVVCMDLGGVDLTSSAGKLQLTVLAAVAEFERQRLRERTMEGLAKAASEGRRGGRPMVADKDSIQKLKTEGLSQNQVAGKLGVSLSTVKRNWNY